MDVTALIANSSDVLGGLESLGFSESNIEKFGGEVGQQIAGDDGLDLGDLLTSLTAEGFLQNVDAGKVAAALGMDANIVSQGLNLIAPLIEQYGGEKLGVLGNLAGRLFK